MMILSDSQGLCQSDSKPLPTHELQRRNGGNDRERLTAWKDRLLLKNVYSKLELK